MGRWSALPDLPEKRWTSAPYRLRRLRRGLSVRSGGKPQMRRHPPPRLDPPVAVLVLGDGHFDAVPTPVAIPLFVAYVHPFSHNAKNVIGTDAGIAMNGAEKTRWRDF